MNAFTSRQGGAVSIGQNFVLVVSHDMLAQFGTVEQFLWAFQPACVQIRFLPTITPTHGAGVWWDLMGQHDGG